MGWLQSTRFASLLALSLFSLPPLGINTYALVAIDSLAVGFSLPACVSLSIAVGVLTAVTTPIMIIMDISKRGVWTSRIIVELLWLDILWILWLAAAVLTAFFFSAFEGFCNGNDDLLIGGVLVDPKDINTDALQSVCSLVQTTEAFSWICSIILTIYTTVLYVGARMATASFKRPGMVWLKSVRELGQPPISNEVASDLQQKDRDLV